jgi:hypothetical protein
MSRGRGQHTGKGHAQLCQCKGGREGGEGGRGEEGGRQGGARGGRGEGGRLLIFYYRLEAPVMAQRLGSPRREVWGHKPAAGLLQDVGSKAEGRRGDLIWGRP